MTKDWDKTKFNYHGGYLSYDRKFVARWKYGKSGVGTFKSFMIKNFTPAEYFHMLESKAPREILDTKGFISFNEKKMCKQYGLEPTKHNVDLCHANRLVSAFPTYYDTAEKLISVYPDLAEKDVAHFFSNGVKHSIIIDRK